MKFLSSIFLREDIDTYSGFPLFNYIISYNVFHFIHRYMSKHILQQCKIQRSYVIPTNCYPNSRKVYLPETGRVGFLRVRRAGITAG